MDEETRRLLFIAAALAVNLHMLRRDYAHVCALVAGVAAGTMAVLTARTASGMLPADAGAEVIVKGLIANLFGAFAVAAFIGAPIYLVRRFVEARRPRGAPSTGFAAAILFAWMAVCLYPSLHALARSETDYRMEHLLYAAILRGDAAAVERYLDLGAPVNSPSWDEDVSSPLDVAVSRRQPAIVTLLVRRGADVNLIPQGGDPPLAIAVAGAMSPRRARSSTVTPTRARGVCGSHPARPRSRSR